MLHTYMDSKDSYYNSTLTIIIDPTSIKHKTEIPGIINVNVEKNIPLSA